MQKHRKRLIPIMPRVFITNDNGSDPVTLTQLDLMTSEHELRESMLSAYNELLVMLGGWRPSPTEWSCSSSSRA